MLGSLILYLKGMRIMMFQLSGLYYIALFKVITKLYIYIHTYIHTYPRAPFELSGPWLHKVETL